ncbi:hypothetical protein Nepgr_033086 [Nepenthes gracilis]|uniref:Uncharacterized protein n=1 Tax=Nepenthes gracilis TaxID=150966 RepID=A0AAD3Y6M4_NEPGR|nr:hypothetical protein Nepgr_033086 [Nepenthes gracilis]
MLTYKKEGSLCLAFFRGFGSGGLQRGARVLSKCATAGCACIKRLELVDRMGYIKAEAGLAKLLGLAGETNVQIIYEYKRSWRGPYNWKILARKSTLPRSNLLETEGEEIREREFISPNFFFK